MGGLTLVGGLIADYKKTLKRGLRGKMLFDILCAVFFSGY